jgi:hypothetical protein
MSGSVVVPMPPGGGAQSDGSAGLELGSGEQKLGDPVQHQSGPHEDLGVELVHECLLV